MLPILRADFEACQTYAYVPQPPLACPITTFGGFQDEATVEQLQAWREQTISSFRLRMFPGDHFFVTRQQEALLQILAAELLNGPSQSSPPLARISPS